MGQIQIGHLASRFAMIKKDGEIAVLFTEKNEAAAVGPGSMKHHLFSSDLVTGRNLTSCEELSLGRSWQ